MPETSKDQFSFDSRDLYRAQKEAREAAFDVNCRLAGRPDSERGINLDPHDESQIPRRRYLDLASDMGVRAVGQNHHESVPEQTDEIPYAELTEPLF